ncbi:MAG: AlkA N-terminal domain-containing protein [Halioglobus sp.]
MMTNTANESQYETLDIERCRLARLSRDSRFDGEFFIAVKTTGIYCRPICPVRPPAEKNVRYFRHAAQAAESGYRPCLRCRPESAPNSPAWRGSSTTVHRALELIAEGALNANTVNHLAERLGVGERYLRKLFARELGLSPLAVAQNQRLLFAKKLLVETELAITEVAFAAGYSSVRRFNSAVRNSFSTTPGALRKRRGKSHRSESIALQLQYRPPYDWDGVIGFFGRHAVTGVEEVTSNSYRRNLLINGECVPIQVRHLPKRNALQLQLGSPHAKNLMQVVAQVRQMFDLDANPQVIHELLVRDPVLESLIRRFPGIRTPTHGSVYESTVRTIVGQQVSVAAARSACSKLANTCATDEQKHSGVLYFPASKPIAELPDECFPMPRSRRNTLRTVCQQSTDLGHALDLPSLAQLKGIGPWTTAMIAMRGYGNPDIFPAGDLGLIKAYGALDGTDNALTNEQVDQWRPWRSYAANLLWRSLSL